MTEIHPDVLINSLYMLFFQKPPHSAVREFCVSSSTKDRTRQEKKDRVIFLFEQELSEVAGRR